MKNPNSAFASGGRLEVEVELGPEFEDDDASQIEACTNLSTKFPFGLIGTMPQGSLQCPSIEFWGYHSEFCWLLDVYNTISPAVLIVLLIQFVLSI